MSGTALQATLRNPLAEPYLLGVSGGAAVGAVLAVVAGLTGAALLPLAAFAGAVAAVVVALLVARAAGGRADGRVLLMAGVVVGAFANAAIMIILANAPADSIRNATWWMMGSVGGAEWKGVQALAVYVAIGGGVLWAHALDVDVLTLGEEPAAALGVRQRGGADRLRRARRPPPGAGDRAADAASPTRRRRADRRHARRRRRR